MPACRYCHPSFGCDCGPSLVIAEAALSLVRSWSKDWLDEDNDPRILEDWRLLVEACEADLPEDEED